MRIFFLAYHFCAKCAASPHIVAKQSLGKTAGNFGRFDLNGLMGLRVEAPSFGILTLSFGLKCAKIGQIEAWKVASIQIVQFTVWDFFKL